MRHAASARIVARGDLGAPFALAVLLALPVAALPPADGQRVPFLVAGAALCCLAIALGARVQLRGAHGGTLAPALVLLVAVAALRQSQGGSGSGFSFLLVVPLLWVALHGTRGELGAFLIASAVAITVPILALGPPDYPPPEWRRVAVWLAVGPLVGVTVHLLVARARDRAAGEARAREFADAIVSTAAALIVVLDVDGRVLRFNRACERVTGFTEAEVLGERFDERLVPAEAATEVGGVIARLRAGDVPTPHENEWVTRDGERRLIVWSNAGIADARGGLTHVIASGIDVTDVRRTERAREEAQARFRAAFEHAPIGVALVDAAPPWRLADANPALCRLLGVPREALAGTHLSDLLEPGQERLIREALQRAARTEAERAKAQLRLRGAGGEELWVEVSAAWAPVPAREDQLVVHLQDVTERKRHEEQLRHLADHDPLTGLLNRRRFAEELDQAIRVAERYREPAALLTLDLDGFKAVNDLHGHAAGDELLVRVARALRERLRESDVVARLGGDEFAVLLPRLDGPAAAAVARDLLRHLAVAATLPGGAGAPAVTASVGVAAVDPELALSPQELLVNADAALYEAKAAGRNRAALARSPAPSARLREAV